MDLFDTPKATSPKVKELFKAVDALNRHYGRGMVFSASEGIKREWKMKRSLLSKRATTCWDDLMVVK
jgi:DNA polymerase V